MPLLRGRVRVDKRDVYSLIDTVLDRAHGGREGHQSKSVLSPDLLAAVESVRESIRNAYPVPLTDQVRLPISKTSELARALRAVAADT